MFLLKTSENTKMFLPKTSENTKMFPFYCTAPLALYVEISAHFCFQSRKKWSISLAVWQEMPIFASRMISRTECIAKLQTCKNVVADRFGVRSMRLFGSVARNEQKESSDVDICVEMAPSLLRRSGLKIYLEDLLQCPVDVLRIHKNMDRYLTQQIERDGILIFK